MRNSAGEKAKRIIEQEFDGRMAMAVVTYILDKGFENLKEVTEEEILKVKGNALMTDRFCQALVRAAVRICKECHEIDDFLPFIVNYLYVPNAKMKEIDLYYDDYGKHDWEYLLDKLDVDYEESPSEIDMITINANVIATYEREERF